MIILSDARGFTLIELVIVIIILGILAATVAPKVVDLKSEARISTLNSIAGSMQSTISLVQAKARVKGLSPTTINPPGGQSGYVVDFGFGFGFGFGSAEVYYKNLCPESTAELGTKLDMKDFLELDSEEFAATVTTQQYTFVGYDIPTAKDPVLDKGCYVIYDSYTTPDCTVTIVTDDC